MSQSGKVYVIDDDPAMRDSLDFLLGSAGFDVRLFDSAQGFLDELANLDTGCVLTDVLHKLRLFVCWTGDKDFRTRHRVRHALEKAMILGCVSADRTARNGEI